jgi:hypothetical protein
MVIVRLNYVILDFQDLYINIIIINKNLLNLLQQDGIERLKYYLEVNIILLNQICGALDVSYMNFLRENLFYLVKILFNKCKNF